MRLPAARLRAVPAASACACPFAVECATAVKPRILIVDGDSTELLLISTALELAGYEIDQANGAQQALAAASGNVPDLILVDASSLEADELAFTRRLRSDARLRDVPLVALGAMAVQGDPEKPCDAQYSGYIAKPIDSGEFPRQVAAFLPVRTGARTFLIVDDHPSHVQLLRLQLEAEGHTVLGAGNGVEALAVLAREHVNGIVSDILMPQMDGYTLCLEVRKSESFGALPFVLYTGTHISREDREMARAVGADAYIEKPASIQTILAGLGAAPGKRPLPATPMSIREVAAPVLKQYSQALVRKLEETNAELARAYRGLAQTEARLSGMVEATLDAIVTVDEREHIVLFNPAAEKMFGYPRAEVLGRALSSLIPPRFHEAHHKHLEHFGKLDSNPHPVGMRTVWGLHHDQSEFPIESSFSKLETPEGRLYTVFLRDISERYRAEQAMARSAAALRQAQQLAKLAHIVTGPEGALEDAAGTLAEFLDVEPSEIPTTSRGWLKLVHPADRGSLRASALEAAQTATRTQVEYRLKRGDSWIHIRHMMDPLPASRDSAPQQISWFHTLQDISDWKDATFRIRRLHRVQSVLSAINALIVRTNTLDELLSEGCRIAVEAGQFPKVWIGLVEGDMNKLRCAAGYGATEAFYQSLNAMLGQETSDGDSFAARALRDLKPVVVNDLSRERRTIATALATGSRAVAVLPLIIEGKGVGVIAIHAEVAGFFDDEEMKLLRQLAGDISYALAHLRKSERIRYLANYDPITGLPNRGLFTERLAQALHKHGDRGAILAVALIDLERFRRINETYGRLAGDELLQRVAHRLQQANSSAARIGVDVFAFEVRDKHSVTEVARAFEDIAARCLSEPFSLAGEELRLGCRGGIAVFPGDGANAEMLLRNAEAALRRAKITSEHCVFYAPDLNARAAESLNMESRLRRAIEREEFVLHYQPKISLSDRRISGVEALIRWYDSSGALVLPGRFIPVLEESGLIGAVGQWALRQALIDQRRWRAAGLPCLRVAVNVSALQLRRGDFADAIAIIMAENAGAALELEITESMIMEQVERTISALRQIRSLGVSVAIDDFGTGYCSLSYLAKLPVSSLKIDRTFIVGMMESADGLAIVASIIALAHSLKLKVVAEGVETDEQERQLQQLACDEAQGYLFSKPVPYEAIEQMLRGGLVGDASVIVRQAPALTLHESLAEL
jgi:PAS domain S-box-containing protein/diguanylate cyclase (GGDEF)-like protein